MSDSERNQENQRKFENNGSTYNILSVLFWKEIDSCSTIPCLNEGICKRYGTKFQCECKDGFVGKYCETNIDDCAWNSCQNDAMCIDGVQSYKCCCSANYTGKFCTIREDCGNKLCKNGGTCMQNKCLCSIGFTGESCEININDCMNNSCINGGICIDGIGNYTCHCPPQYVGKFCEKEFREGIIIKFDNDMRECVPIDHNETLDQMTFSIWIKVKTTDSVMDILSFRHTEPFSDKYKEGINVINIHISTEPSIYFRMFNRYFKPTDNNTIKKGKWYYFAFTWDSASGELVIQWNTDITKMKVARYKKLWPGRFLIGCGHTFQNKMDASSIFNGKIYQFNIWNHIIDISASKHIKHDCGLLGNVLGWNKVIDKFQTMFENYTFLMDTKICTDSCNEDDCYCYRAPKDYNENCWRDVKTCNPNPCKNFQNCVENSKFAFCQCSDKYKGIYCEKKSGCLVNGVTIPDGYVLSKKCENCTCSERKLNCVKFHCKELNCSPNEIKIMTSGSCCPECSLAYSFCTLKNNTVNTFDNFVHKYYGVCRYSLLNDCMNGEFSIWYEDAYENSNEKIIFVRINCIEAVITPEGEIKINNQSVELPYHEDNIISIEKISDSIMISYIYHINITWKSSTDLIITLSNNYKTKICGFCGNFNGIKQDDVIDMKNIPHRLIRNSSNNEDCKGNRIVESLTTEASLTTMLTTSDYDKERNEKPDSYSWHYIKIALSIIILLILITVIAFLIIISKHQSKSETPDIDLY
ncbi:neurogenic locus Notch protein-like [Centruroides vittatus]|uniref:neurogenic locus Notch protein-like n=1 Tax=Centruroides vittatus TaxID=120091 RepID=UPI00350F46A4